MRNNYNNESDLKEEVSRFFRGKIKDFCKNGIYKLSNRWEKAIKYEGSYRKTARTFLDI